MESKVFRAKLDELPDVLKWVRTHLKKTDLTSKQRMQIELSLEEAVVNIISYAQIQDFTFGISTNPQEITFELTDTGAAFNPLKQPESEIDLSLEDRPQGSLGIHLIRKCMDTILYYRKDEKNILILIKKCKKTS